MIEWPSTSGFVETIATMLMVDLSVVRRKAGGLVQRWEQRWKSSLRRYENLETPARAAFSSARLRFCTGETKVQPIGKSQEEVCRGNRHFCGRHSPRGKHRPVQGPDQQADTALHIGNRAGTTMLTWHPIVEWSARDVFAYHATRRIPLHGACSCGADRLSCSYCVLAGLNNLAVSSTCEGNHPAYRAIVGIEAKSGFSFQPGRWLADVSPQLLDAQGTAAIRKAKLMAERRRTIESELPNDLRFMKGPPRVPRSTKHTPFTACGGK